MLQSQAQWCPGWKIESYIPALQDQLTMFIDEMDEDIPYPSVCLSQIEQTSIGCRGQEVRQM